MLRTTGLAESGMELIIRQQYSLTGGVPLAIAKTATTHRIASSTSSTLKKVSHFQNTGKT